ncbi:phenazine-specific anthranilate synthase component I [Streptomyces spinoverrucosus]|uniref:anthranilate synthase n=1 Tax=Streptomyces spinoverrucosus TaxID=284043 RepID=A0A4Y3V910_9ACTN|nr:chorismate-binding protein [Streptomyces spinoverrucosus]GEC03477.1 phenazine-specific anthranilate synthase component I [Streptomyces spinoverrucosus]GHB35380.1 phenazine-specific anthranilate synthase component I [Streptomyces spinoverrucosus]
MTDDLLGRVLDGAVGAYALLYRPEATGPGIVELLAGDTVRLDRLAELSAFTGLTGDPGADEPRHEALALVPYRQLAERGYEAPDDGAPLIALVVREQTRVALADVLARVPAAPATLSGGRFEPDDDSYAATVRRIVDDEIGTGQGANFVVKRSFVAHVDDHDTHTALRFFRRLLGQETGAYWTFLVHTGDRTLVGASPERHISLDAGRAVMNPISGTYRYPPTGPVLDEVMAFLRDTKETDELYMVVDEELKMMGRICEDGGRVVGPRLKEMARLAHTEYFIEGRCTREIPDILHETLFAPTVTGSPVENAARVIARYEPAGRGYYAGLAALIGRDGQGGPALDSAILIRTADVAADGRVEIGVGATLVRHSDPAAEVAETRAKAAGLIDALAGRGGRLADHPEVRAELARRNATIAGFWLASGSDDDAPPGFGGRTALVIDAEDTFTAMLAHQLRALGMTVTVRRYDEPYVLDGHDLVVMGPGPGDPTDVADPKIAHLRAAVHELLDRRLPFLGVCLSHQVLASLLGLRLRRRLRPSQGEQRRIDLFGESVRVGFYNTFAAHGTDDKKHVDGVGVVEICRDPDSGEVHALRGPGFASLQFHPESLLTQNGPRIVGSLIKEVLRS